MQGFSGAAHGAQFVLDYSLYDKQFGIAGKPHLYDCSMSWNEYKILKNFDNYFNSLCYEKWFICSYQNCIWPFIIMDEWNWFLCVNVRYSLNNFILDPFFLEDKNFLKRFHLNHFRRLQFILYRRCGNPYICYSVCRWYNYAFCRYLISDNYNTRLKLLHLKYDLFAAIPKLTIQRGCIWPSLLLELHP
jgi:hypothetical protein